MNKIAEGIPPDHPSKKEYMDLASNFRFPYWDWAKADTPSVYPFEAAMKKYDSVFTGGFDVKTLPDSDQSVFVKNIFGKGIVERYNPLHHAPFEQDDDFPPLLKPNDLKGIKYVRFISRPALEESYIWESTLVSLYFANAISLDRSR